MSQSILQPKWREGSTVSRFMQLEHFFNDKHVLDIGCAVGYQKKDWLHAKIKGVAKTLYAIDVDVEAVESIKRMGFEVEHGDAQGFSVGKKFELVHAGELIEHLDNPAGFLRSVRDHLSTDGLLLMTTPNGLRISNTLYAATGGLRVNKQHTCWYCEYTITSLLKRMGFEVVEIGYVKHQANGLVRKMMLSLRSWILPDRVAWNTLYVVARLEAH